nr:serine/threonine-protein kinase [Kibdelosporangium phytohabitans]
MISELGAGGFGRVWKAHDETLNVYVAVKELRLPRASSPAEQAERTTRAAREARNAAALRDHPNIVAVHDVVIHDDSPWIVMRLVDGHSIDEMIASGGPLPADTVTKIAIALLEALEAAHRIGIVHRDVKPGNVMVARTGEVLLADFGIAVQVADTALTATGVFVGALEYVAPERLRGNDNTAAGDLFSLGATLYHAIEGTSPFRRDDQIATLGAVLVDEVGPPELAPPRLAAVITRLLAKDPARRPTVRQALAMLTGQVATSELPISADRAELLTRAAGAMKAELARRIGQLAADHGIRFAAPPAPRTTSTTVMKPREPRSPTARVQDVRPSRPLAWRRTTGLVLLTALFGLGVVGLSARDWSPEEVWSSLRDALVALGGDPEFGIFVVISAVAAFFLAMTYGIGGAVRIGRAVAPAGRAAVVFARIVFGPGGFALGAVMFYSTVAGGVDLLLGGRDPYGAPSAYEYPNQSMEPGVAAWVVLGVVIVVQVTAQIWLSAKPPRQAMTAS